MLPKPVSVEILAYKLETFRFRLSSTTAIIFRIVRTMDNELFDVFDEQTAKVEGSARKGKSSKKRSLSGELKTSATEQNGLERKDEAAVVVNGHGENGEDADSNDAI